MAGKGPQPKEERARDRDTPDKEQLHAVARAEGWDLPAGVLGTDKVTGELVEWNQVTKDWWQAWRESPQAQRMLTEPDWFFMLDTALMHHQMWSNQRWDFAAEVRLRAAKFGATPEDRARLKFTIEVPEQFQVGDMPVSGNVSSITGRKKRWTEQKAAADTAPGF